MADGASRWSPGDGGMARLVRAHDWAATPLGPMRGWPRSLRAAVDLVLGSPLAMTVLWGPDLVQVYNDAYRAVMAGKHPAGLGQPTHDCWPEMWDFSAPVYAAVLRGGARSFTAQKLTVLRHGTPEEAFFDLTYSPLRDGPDKDWPEGRVAGVLVVVVEVTARVLAEADLRNSEERFRVAMQAIDGMVFDWNVPSGRVERSDGLRRLLGYAPAEAEPTVAWWDGRVHPEDLRRKGVRHGPAVPGTGDRFVVQARVRHRDGRWVDVQDTGIILRDGAGRPVRVIGSSIDVTQRKRAEEVLRESEARFRGFAENSADVLWIADRTGTRLEYLSPAFERTFGEGRERTMAEFRHWRDIIHPEDRDAELDFLPRVIAGEVALVHYRVVRPADGRVVHLRDTGFPIRGEDGAVVRVAGVVQDVTDIARAGEALRAETERFRTLAEGIPQLVWRSGDDGLWTWSSPQWRDYTGQTQDESHGWGWLEAVHPDDREETMRAWHGALPHGRLDVEYRVRRAADGAWRWHQTRSVPVRGPPGQSGLPGGSPGGPGGRITDGPILEWLGTTTDIEDLKRLQGEQGVLVAELQHRTRNLLAVVRNVARRSIPPSPERDEYDARLAALGRVQGFLSRSTAYTVPLADVVEAELQAVGDGASDKVAVSGPTVKLPGESVQAVALAVHELATNAVKYGAIAQAAGRLSVTWRVEGSDDDGSRRLVIDWRESGVAMPDGPPARRGYGSELITRALPYQLRAETALEFTPDGVRCRITLPASAFTRDTEEPT